MDFDFDTGTIYGGLSALDVTTLPPLGGQIGVLTIFGTGAITLPQGTTADEPALPSAGMFRYNTDVNQLEYYDSTTWQQLTSTAGTVSSFQTSLAGLTPSTATTGAITLAGTLGATSGGTGSSSAPTAGQFLYSSAGTTYAPTTLSGVAVTTFSAGTTGLTPSSATSGAITLAGILGLANGGTNANLTAVSGAPVYSTGSAFAIGTAGTSGQAYISGGAGAPTWQSVASTITTNQIIEGNGSGAFTANGATFVGSGSFSGVTLSGTVTNATDATTKQYVDSVANGLSWKTSVLTASTANIDLTTGGLLTIDGVTVADGDRVLVKDQTLPAENGIYIAHAGSWTRSTDMDSTTPINEINGAAVFVEQGSTWADTAWVQVANVVTLGTDPIIWSQFAGPGSYTAGNGLQLIGNQFSLVSPVSIANGGTALSTTPTNGQLLIGNGASYTLSTITAGTAISVVNGSGSITINNTGVTSLTGTANQITVSAATGAVTLSVPSTFIAPGSIASTTTITAGTTLTVSGNTANTFLYSGTAGLVTTTAAPTNGQLLIGSTGVAPVKANLTQGTGIIITNGAGSITVAADTSALVTTFSAGTTGFTPNTPTSGAVTLAGTLGFANGGTGLSALGSANQFLSVNPGATALEYKTITAGTGISVTPGVGVLTIANTGVTSVALALPVSVFTVTGSPVTTTGTLTGSFVSQSANTVFAAPDGSSGAPTFRSLVFNDISNAIQLYRENPSTPTTPVATGANAVAIGSGSTATADGSLAEGSGSNATVWGGKVYANGLFATAGDAQSGMYILRSETTNNTATVLFLDGTGGTQRLVVGNNSVWTFDILVTARRTDATGGGAGYRFVGVIRKDGTSGSTTFVGTPSKTVIGETDAAWDAAVTANTTNGDLRVTVTGQNAKTIRWVAVVQTAEVTN